LVSITLEESNGGTLMTFEQAFFTSKKDRDGHASGWCSAFGKLQELLD